MKKMGGGGVTPCKRQMKKNEFEVKDEVGIIRFSDNQIMKLDQIRTASAIIAQTRVLIPVRMHHSSCKTATHAVLHAVKSLHSAPLLVYFTLCRTAGAKKEDCTKKRKASGASL